MERATHPLESQRWETGLLSSPSVGYSSHVPLRACYLCCQLLTTSYFSNSAVIPALGKQTAMVSLKEGILGQHKAPSEGIF